MPYLGRVPKVPHRPERLLTVAETAAILGKDVRTVHRMIQRGQLPAQKLPGLTGAYLIDRDALDTPEAAAS